jgi:hypothetical protein
MEAGSARAADCGVLDEKGDLDATGDIKLAEQPGNVCPDGGQAHRQPRVAISALEDPSATAAATSRSRGVSAASRCRACSRHRLIRRGRPATVTVRPGSLLPARATCNHWLHIIVLTCYLWLQFVRAVIAAARDQG